MKPVVKPELFVIHCDVIEVKGKHKFKRVVVWINVANCAEIRECLKYIGPCRADYKPIMDRMEKVVDTLNTGRSQGTIYETKAAKP
jgi:hypothetical protein